MATVKSLEQRRAEKAWEFIQKVKSSSDKQKQKEYNSALRKLPAMIMTSGLGQTVAFYMSKGEGKEGNPHTEIANNLAKVLGELLKFSDLSVSKDLINKIKSDDHEIYILLSKEALKYSTWLKRFAESQLEG